MAMLITYEHPYCPTGLKEARPNTVFYNKADFCLKKERGEIVIEVESKDTWKVWARLELSKQEAERFAESILLTIKDAPSVSEAS